MLRDEKAFEVFVNAVEGAKKFDGIVDIIEPEYDVGILFDNKKTQGYHLWLRGEEGTMMNVEDTHTAYKISKESTNQVNYPSLCYAQEGASKSISKVTELPGS